MNNTGDLFIVAKAWVEPATLFECADNKRMSHDSAMDSQNNPSEFFYQLLSFPRPAVLSRPKDPICPTTLPITGRRSNG